MGEANVENLVGNHLEAIQAKDNEGGRGHGAACDVSVPEPESMLAAPGSMLAAPLFVLAEYSSVCTQETGPRRASDSESRQKALQTEGHPSLVFFLTRFSHGRSGCYGRAIGADGCLSRRPRVTPQNMHELDVPGLSGRAPLPTISCKMQ